MTTIGNIPLANNGQTAPNVGVTHIAFIIDKSGSMDKIRQETISELNSQIETIKGSFKELPTKVSLIYFASLVEEQFFEQDLDVLQKLSQGSYVPNGMTAMYDAIGQTVSKLLELPDANDPNTAFLVITLTDGQDNQSRQYSRKQIGNTIKELKATNKWTFTFAGANIDVDSLSNDLNIDSGNVRSFSATSKGVSNLSLENSRGFVNYSMSRSGGATKSTSFYSPVDSSTPDVQP